MRIQNFRGLKDVTIPLSQFGCLIGENNSGKSSALQAILLLLPSSSKKPALSDFFDSSKPIRIELRVDDVDAADLARIENDQHRASFESDVVDGSVRFVRMVEAGSVSKSQLLISRLGPAEDRWTDEKLAPTMKGNAGAALRNAVLELLPELGENLSAKPTQKEVNALRDEFVAAMPNDHKTFRDEPLGTGLDAGIKNFLPEPIYIEAVKDVADEVKTTDSATFGKLLGLLLEEVQDQFAGVEEQFKAIQKQLSRVIGEDGVVVDERIKEVRTVEAMINSFVQESFPDVNLTITVPVPKMKTILSSAEISADDGHDGLVVSKGDGLKRAVAFAILRAYTNLRASGIGSSGSAIGHYWLLFEEPELYLYPRAQRQLFSALDVFSNDFPVMVTTHSPVFFDADATQSFVKFRKVRPDTSKPPFTEVHPIVIGDDLSTKTAFQIICHENNSIGFFAKQVVLVEGDSDALLLPHFAKLLDPAWDSVEKNISFARTNGKGNIASYRSFFSKFDIPIHVVCDLDALIGGFDKLEPNDRAKVLREDLLRLVDAELADATEITEGDAKTLVDSGEARALWGAAEEARLALDGTEASYAALNVAVGHFFSFRRKNDRLAVLESATGVIATKRDQLIDLLRESRTNVLSLGAIENYYASTSKSRDKVKQAISYRSACESLDNYVADLGENAEIIEKELRVVMGAIFEDGLQIADVNSGVDLAA
ncbi:ATP-dependent endonuclease [Leifsonia sp. YAF41]|uniref:ATP-dependent nuclease n=1 Tax=Leifsonia sp. YAF41 TaxID=3233086 RepID=UPI003F9D526E